MAMTAAGIDSAGDRANGESGAGRAGVGLALGEVLRPERAPFQNHERDGISTASRWS